MKRRYNVFLVACCVLCVVGVQFVHAQDGQLAWTQNLNNGGRVYVMVVDPVNQANLYSAGLDSGVYKSTNAGASWFAANNGLTYRAVQALAISNSNPGVLYAGTDQNGSTNSGVYVSTDAGASWTLSNNGITDVKAVQSVVVDPTNANVALVACFDGVNASTVGVFRTTNRGANWSPDSTGLTNKNILSLAINPLNSNVVYAGSSLVLPGSTGPSKIFKSTNGGLGWVEISSGLPTSTATGDPVRALSISAADTARVLAALFLNDTAGGAYLTTNGGATWVKKHNGLPNGTGTLLRTCLIRPGSTNEFYVGLDRTGNTDIGVRRTIDGGNTWTDFNGGAMVNTYTIRSLAFRTQRDSTLYAGAANATAGTGRGVYEYSWPTHDIGVTALQRVTSYDFARGGNPLAMDNPPGGERAAISMVVQGPFALADTVRFRAIVLNSGSIPESTYQVGWSIDGVVQGTLNNGRPLAMAGADTFLFAWDAGTAGSHVARAWTLLATDADHSNDTASNSFTITPSGGACDTLRNLGTIPAYPTVSFGHASAALGDTLYIVGGDAVGGPSTTVATYCISTATWGTGRPLPAAKTGGDLVACGGNLFYIGGGTVINTTPTPDCYKYNPVTGWSPISNIPTAVTGNTAEAWGDSVIFCVAGGWTTYLTTVQVYRVGSNAWSTSTPLPAGRGRRTQACGLQGNQIFVACGYSGVFRKDFLIGTIVRADSITWSVGPDVPIRPGATGVSRPGGHAVDGRFYVVCGETTPAPVNQDSIYMWDIHAGQWLATVIRGRGASAASNYWGVISSSIVGGKVKIWIPGGSLTGVTATPLWVIDACSNTQPVTYAVPDVIYLKFNAGTTTTPNYAAPGRGNALATITGHTIAPGGQFDSTLLGGEGTGATNWVDNAWAPDLANGSWTIGFWVSGLHLPAVITNACYLFGDVNTSAFRCFWAGAGISTTDTAILLRKTGLTDLRLVLPNPSLGQATYVHFVYDSASATIRGYKNGVLGATGSWVAPSITGSGPFKIAGYSTASNSLVSGAKMDEFRVYSRALDTSEIRQTWNHTLPYTVITDVKPIPPSAVPGAFRLEQNYPNPFNPTTTLQYGLPRQSHVTMKIYNVLGQEIVTLRDELESAGTHRVVWDGRNNSGGRVASGVYFYRIEAKPIDGREPFISVKKMLMLK